MMSVAMKGCAVALVSPLLVVFTNVPLCTSLP